MRPGPAGRPGSFAMENGRFGTTFFSHFVLVKWVIALRSFDRKLTVSPLKMTDSRGAHLYVLMKWDLLDIRDSKILKKCKVDFAIGIK